jgi:hypothetical protein
VNPRASRFLLLDPSLMFWFSIRRYLPHFWGSFSPTTTRLSGANEGL